MSNYARSFHRQADGIRAPRLRSQVDAEFEYREYQRRTNDKQVLAQKPRGSRVFKRAQNVEQRVQGVQQYQKQREAEQQAKRIPTAVRMTRAFGSRSGSPVGMRKQNTPQAFSAQYGNTYAPNQRGSYADIYRDDFQEAVFTDEQDAFGQGAFDQAGQYQDAHERDAYERDPYGEVAYDYSAYPGAQDPMDVDE